MKARRSRHKQGRRASRRFVTYGQRWQLVPPSTQVCILRSIRRDTQHRNRVQSPRRSNHVLWGAHLLWRSVACPFRQLANLLPHRFRTPRAISPASRCVQVHHSAEPSLRTARDLKLQGARVSGRTYGKISAELLPLQVCFVFDASVDLSSYEPIVRKVDSVLTAWESRRSCRTQKRLLRSMPSWSSSTKI
ncbi:hypothetical protein EI94DRAFT_592106 [Lactarius quietus]|nr:hypothetical protein EI94DRAFT_592106 [Lactarius quietus]